MDHATSPPVQVFGVARQMLSLVAGGAIDEWLLSNLRTLRQEHALARVLAHLQAQLWPGGAWFQSLPENQHPVSPSASEVPGHGQGCPAILAMCGGGHCPGGAWFQSLPENQHRVSPSA